MANAFRDLLAKSGYSTRRADSPNVLRERIDNPPGISSRSITTDGVGGPSTLFQDDHGPMVQNLLPAAKNDIATRGIIETTKFNR